LDAQTVIQLKGSESDGWTQVGTMDKVGHKFQAVPKIYNF